jgi:GTPase SAR1 family protein
MRGRWLSPINRSQGFLLIYSIANRRSFDEIVPIHEGVLQQKANDHVSIVLLGNKIDLVNEAREVETEE